MSVTETDRVTSDLAVLAFFWGKIGTFAFLVSLAALLGMMSQQGPLDTLKFGSLGAYTLTLFAIPLISIMIFALSWIGRRHARIAPLAPGSTVVPVGWKVPGIGTSSLRLHVAALSIAINLGVPMIVDVWSLAKFAHGTYYWKSDRDASCERVNPDPKTCVKIGTVLDVIWPAEHGLGNPTQTRYVYQGDKDFIPVLQPILYIGLVLGSVWAGSRVVLTALSGPRSAPAANAALLNRSHQPANGTADVQKSQPRR